MATSLQREFAPTRRAPDTGAACAGVGPLLPLASSAPVVAQEEQVGFLTRSGPCGDAVQVAFSDPHQEQTGATRGDVTPFPNASQVIEALKQPSTVLPVLKPHRAVYGTPGSTSVSGVEAAALMADGVAPADRYPRDDAGALATLDEIRPHVRRRHDTPDSQQIKPYTELRASSFFNLTCPPTTRWADRAGMR